MRFQTKFLNVVEYFGITLYVPRFVKYIATDEDGTITGYATRPTLSERAHGFIIDSPDLEDYTTNGYIPFMRADIIEGNWRDSCLSISQLIWKATHDTQRQASIHH